MSSVISEASEILGINTWWVESIAIEYLDCRELCVGDSLWRFNFDRLDLKELVEVVKKNRLVMRGCLLHNVLPEVAIVRMMRGMVGAPSVNPGFGADVVPEGPVSESWFASPDNPIATSPTRNSHSQRAGVKCGRMTSSGSGASLLTALISVPHPKSWTCPRFTEWRLNSRKRSCFVQHQAPKGTRPT